MCRRTSNKASYSRLSFGLSLNMLSLFGLVLAVGIVVDDAIVVVENVERKLKEGLSPLEASRVSMDEVGTALIAIALVVMVIFLFLRRARCSRSATVMRHRGMEKSTRPRSRLPCEANCN